MAAGGAAGAANGMAGAGRRARGGRRRERAALRGRFGAREGPQRESQNVLSWKGPTRIIDSNSCPCTGAIVRFGKVCLLSSSFEPTVIVNGVTDKISAHVYPKDCFLGADFRYVTTSGAAAEMTAVEKIEEQLASLRIAKRSALSEEPAYVLDVDVSNPAQSESSCLVAVSCSNKSIRVYNRETLNFLREYSSQSGVLNGVRFAHACDSVLFSACSDGTVRCWDIRLATQQATQVFSGYPSNVFLSFDVSCNDLIICAGTEKVEKDAFLVFWDARGITNCASATREPLGVYSESHNDDITKICFHPVKPNSVASGSTDGLVNVFDINKDNEDDALISTCNSDSSVSFIGWSGKDYKEVYCVTHDEGFCWWDIAQLDTEESITLLHVLDVRDAVCIENDSLNYLVGGLYHEKADKLFLLGGTSTGNIHLLGCGTDGLSLVGSLCGGHSATVRSFCWSPADESLVTGGEDAQLLLWKPGAVERSLTKKTSLKIASSVQKRVRVHNSSLKSRKK